MSYQLNLNLQQIATLNIAILFWKRKEVKDEAAKFFMSLNTFRTYNPQWKCSKFFKKILEEWTKDLLPKNLETKLIHIIKMIGKTIFNWYQIINLKYTSGEELINFIDEIKWTSYGTVDEVETFKSSWLNNSNLDIIRVYNFACFHAIEDHIDNLWNKIPENIQISISNKNIYCTFDDHILAYWQHRRDNNLPDLMGHLQNAANDFTRERLRVFNNFHDFNLSIEVNMLRISVYQGYFNATKYFWEKLTEEERDKSVVKYARFAVIYYYDKHPYEITTDYMKSQYVEIFIFLMNQMSNSHKKAFFTEQLSSYYMSDKDVKNAILKMLLSSWPWEELFIPVLNDMMQYQDVDDDKIDYSFFDVIANKMSENYELGYPIKSDKYRCILRETWLIIPAFIKQKMTQFDMSIAIHSLIEVWDLDSLNLIINDQAIKNDRDKLIEMGSSTYHYLIEKNQFEKLDQFIETILRSEEEKKEFKQKINLFMNLVRNGKFQLADKLLDWQNTTPEKRKFLKDNIDHMKLCEYFIQSCEFDLVDEFLDWKIEKEEERNKCKDHFKSDKFVIKHVFYLWARFKTRIKTARNTATEWLKWVLKSDEEVADFKQKKLLDVEDEELNLCRLNALKRLNTLDDFLSWCELSEERIRQIKQTMFERNKG